jgi:5-methylcytosine-specific restriction endonuclease McrA
LGGASVLKICSKCNEEKPISDFRLKRNSCRKCEYDYKKVQRQTPEGKQARQKESKKYRELNLETVRERNRINNKKYLQTPKGKEQIYKTNVRRRSYEFNVEFTPHQRKEILSRDKWTCQCCGIKVHDEKVNNKTKAHIDHIIPISKGGHSEPFNLQVLCRTCNLTKSNKSTWRKENEKHCNARAN